MIYSFQNKGANGNPVEDTSADRFASCDTAHGYRPIPAIQVGVRWPLPTASDPALNIPLPNAFLSSDMTSDQRGSTGHADFMNGWTMGSVTEPGTLNSLIWECLDHDGHPGDCEDNQCSVGGLGVQCPDDPNKSDRARYAYTD